jgi:hypothetical protein
MISMADFRRTILRRYLLGTASIAAVAGMAPVAHADIIDHLTLNVDPQYMLASGGGTVWADPFGNPQTIKLRNGVDVSGGLLAQSGDWYFGIHANYGRTAAAHAGFHVTNGETPKFNETALGTNRANESHLNLDFMVGQDVGLGMFGMEGTSIVSGGVAYGRYIGRNVVSLQYYGKYSRSSSGVMDRDFTGVGPKLSWQASTPISDDKAFSLDWEANTALLIGERKLRIDGVIEGSHPTLALPQVDGRIAIGWLVPNTPLKLDVGYHFQQTWGATSFDVDGSGHRSRIDQGPYIGITAQLF